MQHRNSVRLATLESVYRRQRDAKIERIADYMASVLTPEEYDLFCAALQRDIRDGSRAVFTPDELAAMWRFDELVQQRPDILQMMADLQEPKYANTN